MLFIIHARIYLNRLNSDLKIIQIAKLNPLPKFPPIQYAGLVILSCWLTHDGDIKILSFTYYIKHR